MRRVAPPLSTCWSMEARLCREAVSEDAGRKESLLPKGRVAPHSGSVDGEYSYDHGSFTARCSSTHHTFYTRIASFNSFFVDSIIYSEHR